MFYQTCKAAALWILIALSVLLCPLPGVAQTPSPINFIQGNYSVPQTPQATVTVAFPGAQSAGNLNVVVVGWNDAKATVTSVTDSKGNSYARAVGPTVRVNQATQSIYFARNIAAAAANSNIVTVSFNVAAAYPDIRILEYSGLDPVSPLVGGVGSSGSSTTTNSGSLTTTVPNVLLVAANVVAKGTTGPGAGFISRMITNPNGDIVEDRIVTTTGTYSATAPQSPSGYWVMQMVAFKAAILGSDTTPPAVAITSPPNNQTVTTSPITVSGTASDSGLGNNGISSVTVNGVAATGGTAVGSGTANWSQSIALNPGANTITVVARDNSTNQNSTTAQITVNYNPSSPDTTGPAVAIISHTNNQTVTSSPITVLGTASDSGLGNNGISSVTVNGVAATGGTAVGSGTANWSQSIALNPGANTITVVAKDNSTNQNSTTVQINITYNPPSDTTGPAVAITSHTNNQSVNASPITVAGTASDSGLGNNGISSVTVNGVAASGGTAVGSGTANWSQSIALNPGANTITVVARDNSTNQNSSTVQITVTYNVTQLTGLVAAYGFNETSGTTASDSSGKGNNGTLLNGAVFAPGKNGNAVRLDGVNDFVNLGNPTSLQISGSMTISAWINSIAFPVDDEAVVSKRGNSVAGYQLDTTVDTGPRVIGFKLTNSSGSNMIRYGSTALQLNQWYHIAGVYNASNQTMNVYLNGQLNNGALVGTVTSSQQNSNLSAAIGTKPGNTGFEFAGRIDDVRIYNRALSQAEIQNDMNTGVGGGAPPPPDTIPPIVAITAPKAGSPVFNFVSISASASDNSGVAGVQFFVEGQSLGTEAVSTPYSVVWDTTKTKVGNHVLTAVARDFSNNTTTSAPVSVTVVAATPDLVGQWAAPFNWPIVAVHAHLLRTGEVMASDGQSFVGQNVRVWNPTTNTFTSANINTGTNPFCAGHCALPDGRILVAGGHVGSAHVGVTDTNIFNPTTRQWSLVASMHTPRWYPTNTALSDGRILVTAGEINCDACNALIPEIYNAITNTWTELPGASLDLTYYPHMFVLPDGRVLAASTAESAIVTQALDINTQTWTVIDPDAVDGGSAAMYLPGKVIKSGTSTNPDDPPVPSAETTYVLDMTAPSPKWRETPPMVFPRTYHTLTILPDGRVLATGGGPTTDALGVSDAVKAAELWSPDTETWETMASMQRPRLYHSTALLLPDARVLVAGGGRFNNFVEATDQANGEIYSPPYLFKGARPMITSAPVQIGYGGTMTVQTPDASRIASVSLIKLGSMTHAFNMDQRYVSLSFTAGSGSLNVQTPANANLAPPGYYMLFIVDTNGVPSVATILNIQ